MQTRLPTNITNIAKSNATLSAVEAKRLEALATSIARGDRIPAPALPAHDYEHWCAQFEPHDGEHWHDTEWFFGETYAFRLILEACRYWEHLRDPFFSIKQAELDSGDAFVPVLLFESNRTLHGALHASVWGNRSDLSFSAGGALDRDAGGEELLIIDDTKAALELMLNAGGAVHIVMDNSGAELAGDLLLALQLTEQGKDVVLHVKAHPTYVSDTTVADFHHFVETARRHTHPAVSSYGHSLKDVFEAGRIRLAPDPYWCSTYFFPDMPGRLCETFSSAGFLIVKGDFNYRRVFQDTEWPADTPVHTAVGRNDLPPTLLLRTMKSDVVWGVSAERCGELDAEDPQWRINGKRAVIQLLA